MNREPKLWLLPSIKHYLKKENGLEKSEFKLFVAVALRSTVNGDLWWWTIEQMAKESGLSDRQTKNASKGLKTKGVWTREKAKRGDLLPDGRENNRVRIVYRFTDKVTSMRPKGATNAQAMNARAMIAPARAHSVPENRAPTSSSFVDLDNKKINRSGPEQTAQPTKAEVQEMIARDLEVKIH